MFKRIRERESFAAKSVAAWSFKWEHPCFVKVNEIRIRNEGRKKANPESNPASKYILVPTNEEANARKVGKGPEYDQMLLDEAEKYKVGEFYENRAVSEVRK